VEVGRGDGADPVVARLEVAAWSRACWGGCCDGCGGFAWEDYGGFGFRGGLRFGLRRGAWLTLGVVVTSGIGEDRSM
jgi:hypothetical protein